MGDFATQIGSRMTALTREFDIITHNLANVGTTGYKRRCNAFSKSLIVEQSGTETAGKVNLNTVFDFSQGEITQTGRTLDFALCGKGFFVIETPQGPLYTRNGTFHLDNNNQIADSAGRIVAGQSGPISIPTSIGLSQVSVSSDGSISADGTAIGKFKLVDFKDNEGELVAVGTNCFMAPDDITPHTPGNLIVKQGFRESSNVQMVEELVDMMMVSRLYEANTKFIAAKKSLSKSIIGVAMG